MISVITGTNTFIFTRRSSHDLFTKIMYAYLWRQKSLNCDSQTLVHKISGINRKYSSIRIFMMCSRKCEYECLWCHWSQMDSILIFTIGITYAYLWHHRLIIVIHECLCSNFQEQIANVSKFMYKYLWHQRLIIVFRKCFCWHFRRQIVNISKIRKCTCTNICDIRDH